MLQHYFYCLFFVYSSRFPKKASWLAAVAFVLVAGCRSEKTAFQFRPPERVAHANTAKAPLVFSAVRPLPTLLPQAAQKVGTTRRQTILPQQLPRRAAAVSGQNLRKRQPTLVWQPRPEAQYLDPVQRGAIWVMVAGVAIALLGLILIAVAASGGRASLLTAILLVGLYVGGLTTLAIGAVTLLVATLLKLLQRK